LIIVSGLVIEAEIHDVCHYLWRERARQI